MKYFANFPVDTDGKALYICGDYYEMAFWKGESVKIKHVSLELMGERVVKSIVYQTNLEEMVLRSIMYYPNPRDILV